MSRRRLGERSEAGVGSDGYQSGNGRVGTKHQIARDVDRRAGRHAQVGDAGLAGIVRDDRVVDHMLRYRRTDSAGSGLRNGA